MHSIKAKSDRLRTFVGAARERFDKHGQIDTEYLRGLILPEFNDLLGEVASDAKANHTLPGAITMVVHYTSLRSLISMLKDCWAYGDAWLRMCDTDHLNDPDEGKFLFRFLNLPPRTRQLRPDFSHAYIASFIACKSMDTRTPSENDDLRFWSQYGKDGTGCSLTLPLTTASLPPARGLPSHLLQQVLYGPKSTTQMVSQLQITVDILEPLLNVDRLTDHITVAQLSEVIWTCLANLRFLYKHDAYGHESECRLILSELDLVDKSQIGFDYREENGLPADVRHYYRHSDLSLRNMLASGSSITLGPRVSHPNSMRYFIEHLLSKAQLDHTKVNVSQIPYQKS